MWICERLINTVQKWNKDLRRGMLFLKRLQTQFTDESRKRILIMTRVVMELWKLRRGWSWWNKKEISIPEFKTETELSILKRR